MSEYDQSWPHSAKRPRPPSFVEQGAVALVGLMDDQNTTPLVMGTNNPFSTEALAEPSKPGLQPLELDHHNSKQRVCNECRRLKLKCDRKFPCAVGNSGLLDEEIDQLTVGLGMCEAGMWPSLSKRHPNPRARKFVLAGAEKLHEKIFELCDRVRELEGALGTVSSERHPLLAPNLLMIKTSQELYSSTMLSAVTQRPSQAATAGISHNQNLHHSVAAVTLQTQPVYAESSRRANLDSPPADVAPDILQLSVTFPFPWAVEVSMRRRIRDALPPREEAQRICQEARAHALWQFNLDSSDTFLPNLLQYCYSTPIDFLRPRRLALLLMHLAIGSLVDLTIPLGSLNGEAFHHLARAAVCEIPLMEEPDFDVLHTLVFMIWYHLVFSDDKKSVGYAWNLMGFVAKLAQGMGLHREKPHVKMIPEEHEKRRELFWEILNMDCRMALSLGRPPSICLAHVDIKPPTCVGPGLYVPREEIVYHQWKSRFFVECLTPILEAMVSVKLPPYSAIVDLDKLVRDFGDLPLSDKNQCPSIAPRFLAMRHSLVAMSVEVALLQLHRRYFTDAMNSPDTALDTNHPYALSVLATYLGASGVIETVETLFAQEEQPSTRFLHFWFNTFSAAVTLSLLISRVRSSPLSIHAFFALEKAYSLFMKASNTVPFCSKALHTLRRLTDRSFHIISAENLATLHREESQQLPPFLTDAHPHIRQLAEKMMCKGLQCQNFICTPAGPSTSAESAVKLAKESRPADSTKLPNVYQFSSVGLSADDRYTVPSPRKTPFISTLPRVSENDSFNFEHGALSIDKLWEETSYMAWL